MLHFIWQSHPAVNGILILFNGVNKNPGSAKQRTYVNEATSRFYFFNFFMFFVFFIQQRPLMRRGLAEGIVMCLKC